MEKGKDYELDLTPDQESKIVVKVNGQRAPMVGPFEKLTISFSTKPEATVRTSGIYSVGAKFDVFSNIALQPFEENAPQFAEISALRTKTYHKATTAPKGVGSKRRGRRYGRRFKRRRRSWKHVAHGQFPDRSSVAHIPWTAAGISRGYREHGLHLHHYHSG